MMYIFCGVEMPWTSWQFMNFAAGMWVGAIMDSMPQVVTLKAMCIVQVVNLIDLSYVDLNGLDRFKFYCVFLVVHMITCHGRFGPSTDDKNYPVVFLTSCFGYLYSMNFRHTPCLQQQA